MISEKGIDLVSKRFEADKVVDYDKRKVIITQKFGKDIILEFDSKNTALRDCCLTGKMLGTLKNNELLISITRISKTS